MIIVQKFHSIHDIDTEFIPSLELLLQEDVPSFKNLIEKHDHAPEGDVFTYFLFFGPTQNTPIGFAQLCLHSLPGDDLITWHEKLFKFWKKDHLHWKQVTWKVGDGNSGLFVFDARFSRSGKDKIQSLIREYEARPEIKSQEMFFIKGLQDFQSSWSSDVRWSKERFVLEPLVKASKTYEEYLNSLDKEVSQQIKQSWKDLHQKSKVELGDYLSAKETPQTIPIDEKLLKVWGKLGVQILTFEKDLKVLGCLLVQKGKNGNIFFEPFPFEAQGEHVVADELYTQYALLKFFEMPDARKCHMLNSGTKLVFDEKEDLKFFQEQGFQFKTITQSFVSKLPNVTKPV
ncbi:MAG: hypothetical protein H0V66_13010 [Bdellovibrionales bacterium]|nr:hypothetical protein [Bdellovibrionales bacterium]